MIEFTKLIVEGFCSIGELDLPLNIPGITVIRAANGFGKSTIFSALVWALYGKNIKGNSDVNTWEKYRTKAYQGTKVEIYFNANGQIHRIIRCLKYKGEVLGAKGNSQVLYQIDGNLIEDKRKRGIQEIINQNIGMSYNLFMNAVMFGQGLKRLVQETGTNQRELFEEVFELGYLTKAKKIAQDRYAKANEQYHQIQNTVTLNQRSLDHLLESQELVIDNRKNYESKVESHIESLKAERKDLKAKLKKWLENKPDGDAQGIQAEINSLYKKTRDAREKLNAARNATGISLETLIKEIIKLLRAKKYDASLKQLLTLQEAFQTQEECKGIISSLQDKISDLNAQILNIERWGTTTAKVESQIDNLTQRIKDKKQERPDFESIYQDNQKKIDNVREELKEQKKKLDLFKENSDLYKWAYTDPFGNMGIKSYLFESSLQDLNEILATYSDVLGFAIQFEVDLSSARKDFKTLISMEGQTVQYEDLSGGQKQLVNLAMAFSMNTLIGQAQGVNIAFLDEVFESLSSDNIEVVVGLIRKVYKDKTLFLITHQDSLPIPNSRVLRVKRIKGISRYEF